MAKLRVGIIGANMGGQMGYGSWGVWTHLPALAEIDGLEAVAVATTHQASADETAAHFKIPHAFGDWRALVEHPDVDIVSVCVRVPAHRELVLGAIAAGKHVYCEWPLARDTAEGEEFLNAARSRGIVHAVGLQSRSSPVLRYARDLIATGAIGTVRSAQLSHASDWISYVTPNTRYLQDRTTGAHFLTIPGGHSIDAFCWMLGEFDALSSIVRTTVPELKMAETGEPVTRTCPDQVVVSGALERGALAVIRLSAASANGVGARIEISGDDGDLVITEPPGLHALQLTDLQLLKSGAGGELTPLDVPETYFRAPAAMRHVPAANVAEAYLALAERIAGKDVDLPDFADGVARHKLLDRIEAASAARGT